MNIFAFIAALCIITFALALIAVLILDRRRAKAVKETDAQRKRISEQMTAPFVPRVVKRSMPMPPHRQKSPGRTASAPERWDAAQDASLLYGLTPSSAYVEPAPAAPPAYRGGGGSFDGGGSSGDWSSSSSSCSSSASSSSSDSGSSCSSSD